MNMKFYMTPGSCSMGIHILLEEVEELFEAHLINLMAGDHLKPAYLAINPRGSVPALMTREGEVLNAFQSIAHWVATHYPKHQLMPETLREAAHVSDVMDYAVNHLHGEGFTRIFTTERYAEGGRMMEKVRQEGVKIINDGFAHVDTLMHESGYVGEHFSIADAALFYVEFWAVRSDIPLPKNCQKHYQLMLMRSAVRQVLAEEGYHSAIR